MKKNLIELIATYQIEVVGALLFAVITLISKYVYSFFKSLRISVEYRAYTGFYYIYTYHSLENEKITVEKIKIFSRLGKLNVKLTQERESGRPLIYKGNITFMPNNIYFNLEGEYHPEKVFIVFLRPLAGIVERWGILTAVTYENDPFSSVCLINKCEKKDDKPKDIDLVKEGFKKAGYVGENSFLKISKRG